MMNNKINKSGFVYEDFSMPLVDNDLRYTENYYDQEAKDSSFKKKIYESYKPDKNIVEKDFDLIRMNEKKLDFKGKPNVQSIKPLWNELHRKSDLPNLKTDLQNHKIN